MNVVEQWRGRARALRGVQPVCSYCGRFSAVRRARCSGCGKPAAEAKHSPLPRSFVAVATSHRHTTVETMDQIGARGTVMLTKAKNGQLFAFLLAESDVSHAEALVGEALDLVLKRKNGEFGPFDPIVYTRKLAASTEARLKVLKKNPKSEA